MDHTTNTVLDGNQAMLGSFVQGDLFEAWVTVSYQRNPPENVTSIGEVETVFATWPSTTLHA